MEPLWYKNAVIYGLDVKTFQDSNGDGIGDFPGLTSRLDYLKELGITCLWLLPFYKSPNRDNGYDVSDFYSIHPDLGTFHDFQVFVKEAHKRNIRVIIDLVVHHTSTEHPWFQAARVNKHSIYRDYYIWSEKSPDNPHPGNAFPGPESDTWHYDEVAHAWYFHQFYHFQPDLNFANKEVQKEVLRIIEFWIAFGIDGFRIDAAGLLFSYKGLPYTVPKVPGAFLKKLSQLNRKHQKDNILLGEADKKPREMTMFFNHGNRVQTLLNFLINQSIFAAFASENVRPLIKMLERLPTIPENTQWIHFIRNLDELNINKLSEADQQAVYAMFGRNPNSHIYNRGLRRRIAPMMGNNIVRLKSIFALLFGLPGTPLICYGDEIGMGENLRLPERTSVRTPMQWSDQKHAGFSTIRRGKTILPVISHGPFSYKNVNVERAQADRSSLYHFIKQLIEQRKQLPILGNSRPEVIDTGCEALLAFRYQWEEKTLIALYNVSKDPQRIEKIDSTFQPFKEILRDSPYTQTNLSKTVTVNPYGYRWFYAEKK